MTVYAFNVRAINRLIQAGERVTARYRLDGTEHTGRIRRARLRHDLPEVQCYESRRWAQLLWLPGLWKNPGVPW